MRLNLKGRKYKYLPSYYRYEDRFHVKPPQYSVSRNGKILHDGEWKECRFYMVMTGSNPVIYVSPSGAIKDGVSELGPVNHQGFLDIIYLGKSDVLKINLYDFLFYKNLGLLKLKDKAIRVRKNLKYITLAFIGSLIYFLINHFFDGFLQELINQSNIVQSLIVFLSLSSIVNIFHPFTFRKEVSIEDVDELIKKRQKDLVENFENYKDRWGRTTRY